MKNVIYQSLNHEKKRKGFLRVPHVLLDNLFSKDQGRQLLAWLHLTILHHIFYKDGVVTLHHRRIICRQNEWITSYRKLAEITNIGRAQIPGLLQTLVDHGVIVIESCSYYTRIHLIDFELPEKQPARNYPPKKPVTDHIYIPQYTLHRKKEE